MSRTEPEVPPTTELSSRGRCRARWKQALTTPRQFHLHRAIPAVPIDTPVGAPVGPGSSLNQVKAAVVATLTNLQAPSCVVQTQVTVRAKTKEIESALPGRFKRQVSKAGIFCRPQAPAPSRDPVEKYKRKPAAPSRR